MTSLPSPSSPCLPSMCRFKTPPCVPPPRPHVVTHVRVVLVHTDGDVLNLHTGVFPVCHTTHHTHNTPQHTPQHIPQHHNTQNNNTELHTTTHGDRQTETEKTRESKTRDERKQEKRRDKMKENRRETRLWLSGFFLFLFRISGPSNNFEFSK